MGANDVALMFTRSIYKWQNMFQHRISLSTGSNFPWQTFMFPLQEVILWTNFSLSSSFVNSVAVLAELTTEGLQPWRTAIDFKMFVFCSIAFWVQNRRHLLHPNMTRLLKQFMWIFTWICFISLPGWLFMMNSSTNLFCLFVVFLLFAQ